MTVAREDGPLSYLVFVAPEKDLRDAAAHVRADAADVQGEELRRVAGSVFIAAHSTPRNEGEESLRHPAPIHR